MRVGPSCYSREPVGHMGSQLGVIMNGWRGHSMCLESCVYSVGSQMSTIMNGKSLPTPTVWVAQKTTSVKYVHFIQQQENVSQLYGTMPIDIRYS